MRIRSLAVEGVLQCDQIIFKKFGVFWQKNISPPVSKSSHKSTNLVTLAI